MSEHACPDPARRRAAGVFGLLLSSLATWPGRAQEPAAPPTPPLSLTIGRQLEDSAISDISEQVMKEAFRRAGLLLQFKSLPLPRSIEAANDGDIDGDLMRIADVARLYPDLIAVPTPINRIDVAIYGATDAIRTRTRAEIAGLRIGFPRGIFVLKRYSQGMSATEAQTMAASFEMLANARIDAVMMVYLDIETRLADGRLQGAVAWPKAWASEPAFFYLNRRHAALVPRLDAALVQMKSEGLIDKYYADTLQRLKIRPLEPAGAP